VVSHTKISSIILDDDLIFTCSLLILNVLNYNFVVFILQLSFMEVYKYSPIFFVSEFRNCWMWRKDTVCNFKSWMHSQRRGYM